MKMVRALFIDDMRHLLRNVIAGIVVVGLILVPPLYAWFTTLGFWDPYANTGNIKVAVASADEGYQSDLIPTRINAGDQIISALRANDQFDWQFVSEEKAVEGVKSGEYYAAMVIPKSFSADLMTVFSGHITDSHIVYYSNEKENAIAQRVTSTGASALQETIDQTFTKTVASVALDTTSSLTSFMSGEGILTYAQTLIARIDNAAGEVNAAADQAVSYADLMRSTASLVSATSAILGEAAAAPDTTTPLIDETRAALTHGQDALGSTASAGDEALTAANSSYESVSQAVDQAFSAMKSDPAAARTVLQAARSDVEGLQGTYHALREKVAVVAPNSAALRALDNVIGDLGTLAANLQAAEGAIGGDTAALDEARSKIDMALQQAHNTLNESQSTYRDQLQGELGSLADSLSNVGSDTASLAQSLKDTAAKLGTSTESLGNSLSSAEASLRSTADTLRAAAGDLAQARDDLQHALNTGDINEVRRIIGNNPAAVAQFLAAPTHLERHAVYAMADNGSAMSPFYTSLCLWIGAIFMVALMSTQVSETQQKSLEQRFGRKPTQAELYLGRYGVFAVLGLAQALVVGLGNVFFLGIECQHFWLYLAACCLTSVVCTNLVYTLTVSFGNIGKAIAIIGLVLQLGGAGGLMPVQMLSAPLFQAIYPWLPFAHSMPALEGAMAGIYGNHYLVQMALLAAFLVPSLILGLVLRRPVIRLNNWFLSKLDETKVV